MPRIFLNYRQGDAAGWTARLWGDLTARYGAQAVFSDVASIESGEHFAEVQERAVRSADVLLVVIGPDWLGRAPDGQRRIDNPNDVVRLEIEAALTAATRVLPVLVGGAQIPAAEELPEPLRPLVRRAAVEIRDSDWESDVAALLRALDTVRGVGVGPIHGQEVGSIHGDEQLTVRAGRPPAQPVPVEQPSRARELSSMLREAALAGVVPASVSTAPSLPVRIGTEAKAQAELLAELQRQEQARELARVQQWAERDQAIAAGRDIFVGNAEPARVRPRGLLRLVRFAVPLALVGAGVLVAKWLLGWFSLDIESGEQSGDTVVCTVFAPASAAPSDSILIQVFAHLQEQADDARAIAMELDTDARRRTFRSLEAPVPLGSRLHFELRMPGLEIDAPVASLVWRRRTEAVQFGVRVPPQAAAGAVIGTLEISVDSAPVGHVKFKLDVGLHPERAASEQHGLRVRPYTVVVGRSGPAPSEPQGERALRYSAAFISYASADREKVLARVQMLSAVGIRYFQDLLSLEPGDRWEKKIELGIDECDLFLLFWSSASKQSEWVRKEVRYALERRGPDELSPPEIRPVMLEGPPIVKPWDELAHLHFNDRLLYFMRPPDARPRPSP